MQTNADLFTDFLINMNVTMPRDLGLRTGADILEVFLSDLLHGDLDNEHALIVDLVREKGYKWDRKRGVYVSRWNGQVVKESTVRRSVEKFNSSFIGENINNHTERFLNGEIKLQTWQTRVAKELKSGHVINAAVGRGGRAQMTHRDWGKVGRRLRDQYKFLNGFAQEIKSGRLTAGQIRYRVGMYAKSIRSSYFGGLTAAKAVAGYKQEKRVTNSEKPCGQCTSWESRGWQPIGSVPEPGTDCDGYTNCRCNKEYK